MGHYKPKKLKIVKNLDNRFEQLKDRLTLLDCYVLPESYNRLDNIICTVSQAANYLGLTFEVLMTRIECGLVPSLLINNRIHLRRIVVENVMFNDNYSGGFSKLSHPPHRSNEL